MISFTNSIAIDRPISEVYSYVSDLVNTPKWNWAITKTEKMTPGPVAVGTRYRQTRSVPHPASETLEITAADQDERIVVEGTLAGIAARLSYRLDPAGTGTSLTNQVTLEPSGPSRLIAPFVRARIEAAVAANLGALKELLEESANAPTLT